MPAPKSVVKINKDGITFVSSVDKASYYLFELCRAALRDVGRFIRKTYTVDFYNTHTKRSGLSPKAISFKVLSSANTQFPRVEIGIPKSTKAKPVTGYWAFYHEHGTKHVKKSETLKNVVLNNIQKIREIEAQYLSGVADELDAEKILNGVDEDDIWEEAED